MTGYGQTDGLWNLKSEGENKGFVFYLLSLVSLDQTLTRLFSFFIPFAAKRIFFLTYVCNTLLSCVHESMREDHHSRIYAWNHHSRYAKLPLFVGCELVNMLGLNSPAQWILSCKACHLYMLISSSMLWKTISSVLSFRFLAILWDDISRGHLTENVWILHVRGSLIRLSHKINFCSSR